MRATLWATLWATMGGVLGKIPRPSPAMVMALVALLVATSGAAFATIPSSSGTITTCYDKGNGTLRVIDVEDGQTCRSTETQLSWKDGITGKVANSDKLDGKSAAQLGVNGLRVAHDQSDADDSAPSKKAIAFCPNARDRMVVVGTGYRIIGANQRDQNGRVVMAQVDTLAPREEPNRPNAVVARAVEAEQFDGNWSVEAEAICATEGTPYRPPLRPPSTP